MVKKIIGVISLLLVLLIFFLGFCNKHNYDVAFTYDETYHWHACTDCDKVEGKEEHVFDKSVKEDKYLKQAATCESPAKYYYSCVCGAKGTATFDDGNALGHSYGDVSYVWSSDKSECTATRICANDPNHVETETVESTSLVTTNKTCTDDEITTYTATFTNPAFTTQTTTSKTVDASGHSYGEATYVWSSDKSECTATRICANDPNHVETETVESTSLVTTNKTCTDDEITTYTATFTNPAFTTQETTAKTADALGHSYGDVSYVWSSDKSECTATRICANDPNHVETETVESASLVTRNKTCTDDEITTYTATFTNPAFTTQETTAKTADALGHSYGDVSYVWSSDKSECTATRICANDPNHVETETVESASLVTRNKTCTDDEITTYTATFTNPAFTTQETTAKTADKSGHDFEHGTVKFDDDYHWMQCSNCDAEDLANKVAHSYTNEVANETTLKEAATCTTAAIYYKTCECGKHNDETFASGDPLGHDVVCEYSHNENYHYLECSRCDYTEASGQHDYTASYFIVEPTENTGGEYGRTCKICGRKESVETLPLSEYPDMSDLGNWKISNNVKLNAKRGGEGPVPNNMTYRYSFKEVEGGFEEDYLLNYFYISHVSVPSSPNYGYYLYTDVDGDRYEITEQQYLQLVASYTNFNSDSFISNTTEDLVNKANAIEILGESGYYYHTYAVRNGEELKYYVSYRGDSCHDEFIKQVFTFVDGQLVEYTSVREIDSVEYETISLKVYNDDVDWIKPRSTNNGYKNGCSYQVDSKYPDLNTALEDYMNNAGIMGCDEFDFAAFVDTLDSNVYTINGLKIEYVTTDYRYYDINNYVEFDVDDTVVIPFSIYSKIKILLDADKADAIMKSYSLVYNDVTYEYEVEETSVITLDDVFLELCNMIEELIPGNKMLDGFTFDPLTNDEVDYAYEIQDGDTFYPIIEVREYPILLKSSLDDSIIKYGFIEAAYLTDYINENLAKVVDGAIYLYFDLDSYESIVDGNTVYGARLYTSSDCLVEVDHIEEGDRVYYIISEHYAPYYVKYDVDRAYYIYYKDFYNRNRAPISLQSFKNTIESEGFENAYNSLLSYLASNINSDRREVEGIYTDTLFTNKLTLESIPEHGDLDIYVKINYQNTEHGHYVTIDNSVVPVVCNRAAWVDILYTQYLEYTVENWLEIIYDEEGLYIEWLYLDEELTEPLQEFPDEDITVYPKLFNFINVVSVDKNIGTVPIPVEAIEYMLKEEKTIFDTLGLTRKERILLYFYYECEELIPEDMKLEGLYMDGAFKVEYDYSLDSLCTVYLKLVPAVIINFDESEYSLIAETYFTENSWVNENILFYRDSFETFKVCLLYYMSNRYDLYDEATGQYFEIEEFYLDKECTIPFEEYPTENITLYIKVREKVVLHFVEEYFDDDVELLNFLSEYYITNFDEFMAYLEKEYLYELDGTGKTIDYLYYIVDETEVKLTSFPTESVTIYIKLKDDIFVEFYDYGESYSVTLLKRLVPSGDFEDFIDLLVKIDPLFSDIILGAYLDEDLETPWTEWPETDLTVYLDYIW